mgnify:CR=1 FL=1
MNGDVFAIHFLNDFRDFHDFHDIFYAYTTKYQKKCCNFAIVRKRKGK